MKTKILALLLFLLGTVESGAVSPVQARQPSGYTIIGGADANLSFADATTYYVGWVAGATLATHTTITNVQMTVPKAGTITRVSIQMILATAVGTTEQVAHYLRLNNTTDTTLSTSETYDTTPKSLNYTAFTPIAVAAGDTIALKIVAPTWATNPTGFQCTILVFVE